MNKFILYLFLIGHILGDFYFQTDKLAKGKDKYLKKLIEHSVIYFICMLVLSLFTLSGNAFKYSIIISCVHFIVDLIKFIIKKFNTLNEKKETEIYYIDQIIHILTIIIVVFFTKLFVEPVNYTYLFDFILNRFNFDALNITSWILLILIIINPCSITIKKMLCLFKADIPENDKGNKNAGSFIGILERIIIVLLLFLKEYSSIGLVLTAKSIVRYKKIEEDPKFSEYYLLGTLLSTLFVILSYIIIF